MLWCGFRRRETNTRQILEFCLTQEIRSKSNNLVLSKSPTFMSTCNVDMADMTCDLCQLTCYRCIKNISPCELYAISQY